MPLKLLIVDDETRQQTRIVKAARQAEFQDEEIVRAGTAAEAEALLERDTFQIAVVDMVLTDSELLEETGIDVIRLIRRALPECRIIALTTKLHDTEPGIRAMIAGADDFISSKWLAIDWEELLVQRLKLWRGVVASQDPTSSTV
jgi:response regulator RpfG family c-di-GMP phosphodiesterase